MFAFIKNLLFPEKQIPDIEESSVTVYERQLAHHMKRMECDPANYEFHRDMVRHCKVMLAVVGKGSSVP